MPTPTAKYAIKAEDKSGAALNSIKGKLKGLSGAFGGMAGSIAGIVGVGGFGAMIKGGIDAADSMQKMSIQLGLSTEFLSEMKHAAELSGTSLDSVTKGSRKLQQSLVDAADGGKSTAEAFEKLGLNVDDLLKLHPDEQLLMVGDALSKMGNSAEKTDTAMALLGKAGAELNQVFVGGAEGVAKMREEAKGLGLTLTRDAADGAANANDALLRLQRAFSGVGLSLATEFAEPIEKIANFLSNEFVPLLKNVVGFVMGVGRGIGGLGAAMGAFFSGEFGVAGNIIGQLTEDLFGGSSGEVSNAVSNGSGGSAGASGPRMGEDPEQRKTRELMKDQSVALKEIARNTKAPKFAVAG